MTGLPFEKVQVSKIVSELRLSPNSLKLMFKKTLFVKRLRLKQAQEKVKSTSSPFGFGTIRKYSINNL